MNLTITQVDSNNMALPRIHSLDGIDITTIAGIDIDDFETKELAQTTLSHFPKSWGKIVQWGNSFFIHFDFDLCFSDNIKEKALYDKRRVKVINLITSL